MRKVIVSEYVTLDGVMQAPGDADEFEHGGWSGPFWGDDIGTFKDDELQASDALLFGRVTYEGFAKAWPDATDEDGYADRMNGLPKFVVTTTLDELDWNNSTAINGDVAERVAALKEQPGQDILVFGSSVLVRTLIDHDLVDEYRLLVHPVVLGSGKRLFPDGSTATLKLVDSRTFDSGVIALTYESARGEAAS